MEAAMPCKKRPKVTWRPQETGAKLKASKEVLKTKYGGIVVSDESTRQRVEPSMPKLHEYHIADKGINSINRYNLVQKFVPMPQAMKIPGAKAAVDKEWKKLEAISAWKLKKSQEQEGGHKRGTKKTKGKCTLLHWWSRVISKNAELEPKYQKYKGRVVLRGDIIKDDTGAHAFPFPLKYIDVTRSTYTDLDVAQEKRIDDHWNVDENRSLPDSRTGFTKFTLLTHRHTLKGFFVVQEETDKKIKQLLDQIIYGLKLGWKLEKPLKKKKKQEWALEKPKLENARNLRGIHFIDPSVMITKTSSRMQKTEIGHTDGSGDAM